MITSFSDFSVLACRKDDAHCALRVLRNEVPVATWADFANLELCGEISSRFWNSVPLQREDSVPGCSLGPFHYRKSPEAYFREVAQKGYEIEFLFEGLSNPVTDFIAALRLFALEEGIEIRAARYNGSEAWSCRAMWWNGNGVYALAPHDDIAQVRASINAEFEITKVAHVFALNLYVQAPVSGGELLLWNILPGDSERARFRITDSGYPYPVDYVMAYRKETSKSPRDCCVCLMV